MAPALLIAAMGCASIGQAPPIPEAQANRVAGATEQRTRLQEPAQVLFAWSLNEAGMRVTGRGVARMEPPYRLRIDLFMGNGETLAQAALVEEDVRIPPWAPAELIPPPPLLWAALGVFRPGMTASLSGGETLSESAVALRYSTGGENQLRFTIEDGLVSEVELLRGGHVEERVTVQRSDVEGRLPDATYRNIRAFRELRITLETVDNVEGFAPDIWYPGR